MSGKATGAQPNGAPNGAPNGDTKHRQHHDGSSSRTYTVEQKEAVVRIRRCGHTEFYKILAVEKDSSDGQIKKAYRKLSLLTHPDKNGCEGADEAFKMVSRAFQILSDPDKKAKYDRFGGDPDSRFQGSSAAGGASPFSGFGARPGARAGPMFEEEISPEELFRQFFGGGGGMGGMGGPFGGGFGGPGFVFNMGGPGIRIHQFGGNNPRRRPHNHDGQPRETSLLSALQGLLPLLLIFVLPLLSSLFSGSGIATGPSLRFDGPASPYTHSHTSAGLKVQYFVNPSDVVDYTAKRWEKLDKKAEGQYVDLLSGRCELEQQRRQRLAQDAQGFFFTDMEKLERARNMPMPSCEKLRSYGYRVGY